MADDFATRREFDQLRAEFSETRKAVEDLRAGNAITSVLATQISNLTQAVAEIKMSMNERFTAHDKVHQQDNEDRVAGRRWLIGMAVAGITALIGLYGWIALFIHK